MTLAHTVHDARRKRTLRRPLSLATITLLVAMGGIVGAAASPGFAQDDPCVTTPDANAEASETGAQCEAATAPADAAPAPETEAVATPEAAHAPVVADPQPTPEQAQEPTPGPDASTPADPAQESDESDSSKPAGDEAEAPANEDTFQGGAEADQREANEQDSDETGDAGTELGAVLASPSSFLFAPAGAADAVDPSTEKPTITSAASTAVSSGATLNFEITTADPVATSIWVSGAPAGVTLTDHEDGTATIGGTAPANSATFQVCASTNESGSTIGTTCQAFSLNILDPQVSVDPKTVDAGDKITITGTEFDAGTTATWTVPTIQDTPQSVTVAADGSFTATLATSAAQTTGTYTVNVTPASGPDVSTTFAVAVADASVTPSSGWLGDSFTVSVSELIPNESGIDLRFTDSNGVSYGLVYGLSADAAGNLTIPGYSLFDTTNPGKGTFTVSRFDSGGQSLHMDYTLLKSNLQVTPDVTDSGGTVNASMTGLADSENVSLEFAGDEVWSGTADSDGTVNAQFTIPDGMASGTKTARLVRPDHGGDEPETEIEVLNPAMTVSPDTVDAGDTTEVNAEDLLPNQTATIWLNGEQVGSVTVTGAGTIVDKEITVPKDTPAGDDEVTITQPGITGPVTADLTVNAPSMSVSPTEVWAGDTVTVEAEEINSGQTVNVYLGDDASPVLTGTANTDEEFTGTFTVPADQASGDLAVRLRHETGFPELTRTITVNAPTIELADITLEQGGSVKVTGSAPPNADDLAVWMHSTPVKLSDVTPGADGAFSATVTVPKDAEIGAHRMVLQSGDSELAKTSFTVTAGDSSNTSNTSNTSSDLSTTGANNLAAGALGIGFLLIAAAATMILSRRRLR